MTLLDVVIRETTLKKVASTKGGEYAGACPWCGGRDRFRVWPYADKPGYWCRQCDRKGDAIQYLRDREGLSYREACQRLGMPLTEPSRVKRPLQPPRLSTAPNTTWQARARAFCEACERALWTPEGAKALAYLQKRGFRPETLRTAQMGYHRTDTYELRSAWGLEPDGKREVWLPRGIIFPWWVHEELWRIAIRRPVSKPSQKDPKYVSVSGGGNILYRVSTLRPNAPAMLVEGMLDALALAQEIGDLCAVVAAGSTTGGRLERWIGRLSLASLVLVSFDSDLGGEEAATWWLKALGACAQRWRPYWDDPSSMLEGGADLRGWVAAGLGRHVPKQLPQWQESMSRWPAPLREAWEERAAMLEVEEELSPEEADRLAFAMLTQKGPTSMPTTTMEAHL